MRWSEKEKSPGNLRGFRLLTNPTLLVGFVFLEIASECLRLFVGICGDSLIPVKLIDVGR